MKDSAEALEKIIISYAPLLKQVAEEDFVLKLAPAKWSKKEILGHLVDSIQNNIRRFIVAQYEEQPHIVYAQDYWVASAGYQYYDTNDLIALWILLNRHACVILKNIPDEFGKKECLTEAPHSIEWLAEDYNKHLLHHLHQILNLESIPYP